MPPTGAELYIPGIDAGCLHMKPTNHIEVRERQINDMDFARRILEPSIATTEAIEGLTGPVYAKIVRTVVPQKFSPELYVMQPRWMADENNHFEVEGNMARQIGVASLIEQGIVSTQIDPVVMAVYKAAGLLTRASRTAANQMTCRVAFDGTINEKQASQLYLHIANRLDPKNDDHSVHKEPDLAEPYRLMSPMEGIHMAGYAQIFKHYWDQLNPRQQEQVIWIGPSKFSFVGMNNVGPVRLNRILSDEGFDAEQLVEVLDAFGSRLVGREIHFAYKALYACKSSWEKDKRTGQLLGALG